MKEKERENKRGERRREAVREEQDQRRGERERVRVP